MDVKFTNKFWYVLHGFFGTKLAIPHFYWQMERINHILEDLLQHYVNPVQDDWNEFFDLIEFGYNNFWQNTPFVMNCGQHLQTPASKNHMCQVFVAQNFAKHLIDVICLTKKHLIIVQQWQKNKRAIIYSEGIL